MLRRYILAKLAAWSISWDYRWNIHEVAPLVYGDLPRPDDAFQFIPCTKDTVPPQLNDPSPVQSWARLYDPEPDNWSWGAPGALHNAEDVFDGRGIYLCGYIDLPLDYTNASDRRITRIAVTKYQVSGLARRDGRSRQSTGRKSEHTVLINPGGPGSSGTKMAWDRAEDLSARLTDSKFDVLGWDPRGVNTSQPSLSCYPHDAVRDRWAIRSGYLFSGQYREVSASPLEQLKFADAVNEAVFTSCKNKFGDFPRFVTTPFVARDIDRMREALGEDSLTGYMGSYGTGLSFTYANMFPDRVGRMVLDAVLNPHDMRHIDGIPRTMLDNVTDIWRDGFLGECISAGPERCALAEPINGAPAPVSLDTVQARMETLLSSLRDGPMPAYSSESGPSVITYSQLVFLVFFSLLDPAGWPSLAQALSSLEQRNATAIATMIDRSAWKYNPDMPDPMRPATEETRPLVLCGDAYDDPAPVDDDLAWWDQKWQDLVDASWLAGNALFNDVLACRQVRKLWVPAEVYRGVFNKTLKNPVLLVSGTYDPGTQMRNGKEMLSEMGRNARLVIHDGYGHSSQKDRSACTDAIIRAYLKDGHVPEAAESRCAPDGKPYRSHKNRRT